MAEKSYDRIFAQLFGTPWLITEEWMHTIIGIAMKENSFDPEALTARKAQYAKNTERARLYRDVGVVPISGPIFPKSNMMTEYSGATSIQTVARDLQALVDNDDIERIILDVDSPGGHVTGINEMANMIRGHNAVKPITAYVSGTGASAAYWLSSAASEIVLDATSRVGSIGVVTAFPKSSGDTIEIVNSLSPNKRPDIESDEGKKVVVEQMDALAEVFINSVSDFRGVSVDTVKKDFGRGGILVGEKAVKAGMADRLGSFDQLLNENGGTSMPTKGNEKALTLETLKADHSDVYQAAFNEGAASANESAQQEIATLTEENTTLKSQIESTTQENATLNDRVSKLEKQETIRQEKSNEQTADALVTSKLSDSTIPPRLHGKVRGFIDHGEFIVDGALDTKAFGEKVDAEIADWEESMSASTDTFMGLGGQKQTATGEGDDSQADDDWAAKLTALGN